MKKILIVFMLILTTFCVQTSVFGEVLNTQEEFESVSNCEKGDKILLFYETKYKPDGNQKPDRYLNAAQYYYYQASKLNLSNIDALVGQARISLHKNKLKDAKAKLFIALNYDELNPKANFYLGETFFKEGMYADAIKYYKQAYTHGYAKDYKTNYQLGVCYNKLNEKSKAKSHLRIAMNLNPNAKEPQKRLEEIENTKTNFKNFDAEHVETSNAITVEEVTDEEIQNLQNVMH